MPSVSASCIASDARVPPMSVLPSMRLTVPSGWTVTVTLERRPTLNQNPDATPRPRFGPSSGAVVVVGVERPLRCIPRGRSSEGHAGGRARVPSLAAFIRRSFERVDVQLLGELVDQLLERERRRGRARRAVVLRAGLVHHHVVAARASRCRGRRGSSDDHRGVVGRRARVGAVFVGHIGLGTAVMRPSLVAPIFARIEVAEALGRWLRTHLRGPS
jgi:hypothetical protein